jgi:hypothetical protein
MEVKGNEFVIQKSDAKGNGSKTVKVKKRKIGGVLDWSQVCMGQSVSRV